MASEQRVQLRVNGTEYERTVEARRTLADFLRDDLGLTGTHLGCEHGVCGACTVIVDGRSARSCLMLAVQTDGAEILTVEGLARGTELHPIQHAFWDHHALQCAFCTPGFLMTTYELLQKHPTTPTEQQVREALSGNLCRCTGYQAIVEAVLDAARRWDEGARRQS